jgi:hypothetical protein
MHQSPRCGARRRVGFGVGTLVVLMASLVCALLLGVLQPATAGVDSSEADNYVARINGLRSSVGAQPLSVDGELTGLAQSCAQRIAAGGALVHTANLAAGVSSAWTKLGENIGMGADNASVWSAFVHSAQHYGNLVNPAFNRVGVGVAYAGGSQWTCHRFMAVSGGGGQPAATRPPAATTRPATSGGRTARPAPDPDPAPVVITPPRPMPGPPPPADSARVSAVLAALRSLTAAPTGTSPAAADADRVSAVLSAMRLLGSLTSHQEVPTGAP